MIDEKKYPNLAYLLQCQLEVFPAHSSYLERRFKDATIEHLELTESISENVRKIAGNDLTDFLADYAWLSNTVLQEELHFRRTGNYRLSSFEEAASTVYSDPVYMHRYMNGLLASQIWWKNHTEVIGYYKNNFLRNLPDGFRHLEVGPGHGLFLYETAKAGNAGTLAAWDVSATSLRNTRIALDVMGIAMPVDFKECNLFDNPAGEFDSLAFSEVLEHLENPLDALKILRGLLASSGRLFVNAPVNSPAPDHLYLFRTPEEVVEMVEEAGLKVIDTFFSPTTGSTLMQARKRELAISAVVIAAPR